MTDRARKGQRPWLLFLLVVGGVRLISLVSCPSLVQLIMRLAMAVLFWKSGILKWAGLLKLNDTAVTLFTAEFMLHLSGEPLSLFGTDYLGCCHSASLHVIRSQSVDNLSR